MKIKFLKKHGIYAKGSNAEVSDDRGKYLVMVKAAEEYREPVKAPAKEKKTPAKKGKEK